MSLNASSVTTVTPVTSQRSENNRDEKKKRSGLLCFSVDFMALGETRARGRGQKVKRSSRFPKKILLPVCSVVHAHDRMEATSRTCMLVGGASGGEVEETGEREGKEEVKKTGRQTSAAGWKRRGTHGQTLTCSHTAPAGGAEPCHCFPRPLVGGAPVGKRRAVTHPLSSGQASPVSSLVRPRPRPRCR